jgi:hypothetical protein
VADYQTGFIFGIVEMMVCSTAFSPRKKTSPDSEESIAHKCFFTVNPLSSKRCGRADRRAAERKHRDSAAWCIQSWPRGSWPDVVRAMTAALRARTRRCSTSERADRPQAAAGEAAAPSRPAVASRVAAASTAVRAEGRAAAQLALQEPVAAPARWEPAARTWEAWAVCHRARYAQTTRTAARQRAPPCAAPSLGARAPASASSRRSAQRAPRSSSATPRPIAPRMAAARCAAA